MKYARCDAQGEYFRVADICEGDPFKFYYHTIAEQFRPCPDDTRMGDYRWSDGTYSRYREPYWRPVMSRYEFLTLFTIEERTAIREAAKTDPLIDDMLQLVGIASEIDINDPNTAGGLDYIASKGLITPERCTELKKGFYVVGEK